MGVVDEVVLVEEVAVAIEAVEAMAEAAAEAEVAVVIVAAGVTITMTTETRPLRLWRDPPDIDDINKPIKFSTMPRCSVSWRKSYKINTKQLRADTLRVSPPPTPSRGPTKTDNDPP